MEDTPVTGQEGAFFSHGEHHIGNAVPAQAGEGFYSLFPAGNTVTGQLGNLILVGLDEEGLFLYGSNEAAAAGIDQHGNAGGAAAADELTIEILRHAPGHAAADGDHIRFRQAGGEIGKEPVDILLRDGLAGLQVFRGAAVGQIPAVDTATGFTLDMGKGTADQGRGDQRLQVLPVEPADKAHGGDGFLQLRGYTADVQALAAGSVVDLLYPHDGFRVDGFHQIEFINGGVQRYSQDHMHRSPNRFIMQIM